MSLVDPDGKASLMLKSHKQQRQHHLTTWTDDKVQTKQNWETWDQGRKTKRRKEGRGGGKYLRETASFNSHVLLWILALLLFLFYKIFFPFFSTKNAFKIVQHFICAVLGRFLWRFKLFIARTKGLSLWKSLPSLRQEQGS